MFFSHFLTCFSWRKTLLHFLCCYSLIISFVRVTVFDTICWVWVFVFVFTYSHASTHRTTYTEKQYSARIVNLNLKLLKLKRERIKCFWLLWLCLCDNFAAGGVCERRTSNDNLEWDSFFLKIFRIEWVSVFSDDILLTKSKNEWKSVKRIQKWFPNFFRCADHLNILRSAQRSTKYHLV